MADYTTIDSPAKHFNTKLYTGNGSTRSITGVGFQPDWTWTKKRNGTTGHRLVDAVRGVTKALFTNGTNTESTEANGLTAFASDGYALGTDGNYNNSSDTYVSWNWLGANGTTSNSDGSITSTVSANQTAGFSIVSYTGNATAGATIGHGLGATPQWVIVKNRDNAQNWFNYHIGIGATKVIYLDLTNASQTLTQGWNDTAPTSSVVSLGTEAGTNQSGSNMIAYCFAEKQGYSKFGSYTGNGNADGTFVYTGFKPAWVMVKKSSGTNAWLIVDNKRDTFNATDGQLFANTSGAEDTSSTNNNFDYLSNGFKTRNTGDAYNGSSATYIYMAFAESPFVTAGTKAAGTAR